MIAPLVQERLQPGSVVDVGCGPGAWPAAWLALGVEDVAGVDGEHVRRSGLLFPDDRFVAHDLRRPLDLGRRFDLVLSLEVAQHVPEHASDAFLDTLVSLGPAVLFSAAVPHQGGDNHINEHWQSWWAERFERRGYVPHDVVRPLVWTNESVDWWYAQNAILYLEEGAAEAGGEPALPLDLVHPRNLLTRVESKPPPLAARVRHAIARRLR